MIKPSDKKLQHFIHNMIEQSVFVKYKSVTKETITLERVLSYKAVRLELQSEML